MAAKSRAKKNAAKEQDAQQHDEELLKHPLMVNPPITPVMVTAQCVPMFSEPDESSKRVGEARMKEVIPVLQAAGPWVMTVLAYEEAWFRADYVAEVEQDAPDAYFKDQQVISDAFEERADQTEEGEPVKTETRPYMEMAEGYGMMVMPETTEELIAQAYAELVYAFEPNAEMMGTYKHIMNVFSPDSIVELEDYVTIPAEIQAGEKTGEVPSPSQAGGGSNKDRKQLGTLGEVNPEAAAAARASWGTDVSGVQVEQDPGLASQGKRGVARDQRTIGVVEGGEKDVELLLEEAAHTVQHSNAGSKGGAARGRQSLENEANNAVIAALTGRRGSVTMDANEPLYQDEKTDSLQSEVGADWEPRIEVFIFGQGADGWVDEAGLNAYVSVLTDAEREAFFVEAMGPQSRSMWNYEIRPGEWVLGTELDQRLSTLAPEETTRFYAAKDGLLERIKSSVDAAERELPTGQWRVAHKDSSGSGFPVLLSIEQMNDLRKLKSESDTVKPVVEEAIRLLGPELRHPEGTESLPREKGQRTNNVVLSGCGDSSHYLVAVLQELGIESSVSEEVVSERDSLLYLDGGHRFPTFIDNGVEYGVAHGDDVANSDRPDALWKVQRVEQIEAHWRQKAELRAEGQAMHAAATADTAALGADERTRLEAVQSWASGLSIRVQYLSSDGRVTVPGEIEAPAVLSELSEREVLGLFVESGETDPQKREAQERLVFNMVLGPDGMVPDLFRASRDAPLRITIASRLGYDPTELLSRVDQTGAADTEHTVEVAAAMVRHFLKESAGRSHEKKMLAQTQSTP